MIRFFKTNYDKSQLEMLDYLLSENIRQLRIESNCTTPSDCANCPYSEICNDIYSLRGYLARLLKGGEA